MCVCVATQDALTDMRRVLGEQSNSAGDLHNEDQCRPALIKREREKTHTRHPTANTASRVTSEHSQ